MRRLDIIKALRKDKERIDKIIDGLESLNTDDSTIKRHAQNQVVFTVFEFMDNIGKIEVEIYNYLKRRGWK